jgi:hypothetical protein
MVERGAQYPKELGPTWPGGTLMRKLLFVVFLSLPFIAVAEKAQPNAADYTIPVHVSSSKLVQNCTDVTGGSSVCITEQRLVVTIGGKKYELLSEHSTATALLRTGDYKAKIVKDESKAAYEYARSFEFLFSDGKTGTYAVTGEME